MAFIGPTKMQLDEKCCGFHETLAKQPAMFTGRSHSGPSHFRYSLSTLSCFGKLTVPQKRRHQASADECDRLMFDRGERQKSDMHVTCRHTVHIGQSFQLLELTNDSDELRDSKEKFAW